MADYEMIKRTNWPFDSEDYGAFALIPTTTSISRQSLLTGLYPSQMENQFSFSKRREDFIKQLRSWVTQRQRRFTVEVMMLTCIIKWNASIILNDIDDIMHGQLQGDIGMGQDVRL